MALLVLLVYHLSIAVLDKGCDAGWLRLYAYKVLVFVLKLIYNRLSYMISQLSSSILRY